MLVDLNGLDEERSPVKLMYQYIAKAPDGKMVDIDTANTQSTSGAIIGVLAAVINVIPIIANHAMNYFANNGGYINFNTTIDGISEEEGDFKWVTIEKIVFGKTLYLYNFSCVEAEIM